MKEAAGLVQSGASFVRFEGGIAFDKRNCQALCARALESNRAWREVGELLFGERGMLLLLLFDLTFLPWIPFSLPLVLPRPGFVFTRASRESDTHGVHVLLCLFGESCRVYERLTSYNRLLKRL